MIRMVKWREANMEVSKGFFLRRIRGFGMYLNKIWRKVKIFNFYICLVRSVELCHFINEYARDLLPEEQCILANSKTTHRQPYPH